MIHSLGTRHRASYRGFEAARPGSRSHSVIPTVSRALEIHEDVACDPGEAVSWYEKKGGVRAWTENYELEIDQHVAAMKKTREERGERLEAAGRTY